MTSRTQFLARLRPIRQGHTGTGPLPDVLYGGVGEPDLRRRWESLGGAMHVCRPGDLPATIASIVGDRGPVLIGAEAIVRDLPGDLRWPECGIAGSAAAGIAVVGGVAVIAATASVVLDSQVAHGRSAALLAPVAVFVVPRDQLVATPAEILRRTGERWPQGLPSQLVFVSGPSRSADIEMTLTRGVHGPGEVHLVLLDDHLESAVR